MNRMAKNDLEASLSNLDDVLEWQRLAREVETLFGAPMADSEAWFERLTRNIDRRSAWCVRSGPAGRVVGGMWLSLTNPHEITITWLAVDRDHRRRGIGSALIAKALELAEGHSVRVVTFGEGHPMSAAAEASHFFYRRLGFTPCSEVPPEGPDGTPREVLICRPADETLR